MFFTVSLAAGPVRAGDYSGMYGADGLDRAYDEYHDDLYRLWIDDLRNHFTIPETIAASDIRFKMPLVGAGKLPLDYYTDPDERAVVIPVLTVEFFDDLSVAMAWFERRGCDTSAVLDYVGIIASREPSDFPAGRYPTPIEALGIPPKALGNRRVAAAADDYLISVMTFIMAHEFGHALAGHSGYGETTLRRAVAQEIEADAFAIDMMRRIPRLPTGLPLFLRAASRFQRPPSDFKSPSDYEAYLRGKTTDPLTHERMAALAANIRKNADRLIRGQDDPIRRRDEVLRVADELQSLGEALHGDAGAAGEAPGKVAATEAPSAPVSRKRVRVGHDGEVAIGLELAEEYDLARFKWASLYYNRRANEVAMEFHEGPVKGALKVRAADTEAGDYPLTVSAADFFKAHDLVQNVADSFAAEYSERDHWLVLKLDHGPRVTGTFAAGDIQDGTGRWLSLEDLAHACD